MAFVFKNLKPTETEKKMFHYAGYYNIHENSECARYVCMHTDVKGPFPKKLKMDPKDIDYTESVTFYKAAETIEISGSFDMAMIKLITDRMKELGWEV